MSMDFSWCLVGLASVRCLLQCGEGRFFGDKHGDAKFGVVRLILKVCITILSVRICDWYLLSVFSICLGKKVIIMCALKGRLLYRLYNLWDMDTPCTIPIFKCKCKAIEP